MFRVLFFERIQKHTGRGAEKVCMGHMHIKLDPCPSTGEAQSAACTKDEVWGAPEK